ncbi:thymidine kinase 2, mitochondrial-like [Neocloeon triangulifer]|uniref:thymidine kinase 2, mitochondrial-like n=1 Tax=Neocloeon triangulifer TaxID=2078957 RepID=UPI00286F18A5|nr:thymidine kinase 2, mitochondrial-like [Neocloeon triangulifer]
MLTSIQKNVALKRLAGSAVTALISRERKHSSLPVSSWAPYLICNSKVMYKGRNSYSAPRPYRVSVEGNIGSGKSTFLSYFQRFAAVETYLEPLDTWRDVQGHNVLDLLYCDLQKWNLTFQHMVQLSRVNIQTSDSKKRVQIFERCVQNNRFCFGEMAYKEGLLSGVEYAIFDKWYSWISNNTDIGLDLIVYLRTNPNTVYQRLLQRSRKEELSVSLEYLQRVHEAHDNWLLHGTPAKAPAPVLVLDANSNLDALYKQYEHNQEVILGRRHTLSN